MYCLFSYILFLMPTVLSTPLNTTELHPLIFKGSYVSLSEYPYACLLHFKNTHPSSCGASLIMVQAVLTAAHCMRDIRFRNGDIHAYFGSDIPRDALVIRRVIDYEIDPKYNEVKGKNNIAVAFLQVRVPLCRLIAKIPLAIKDPLAESRLFSVGWGKQNPPELGKLGDFSKLRYVKLTVQQMLKLDQCNKVTGYYAASGMLCTVPITGHHAKDDGGDGLITNNPRTLVGVLSYVSNGYSVYTGVAAKWDWIVKACKEMYHRICSPKDLH